MSDILTEAVRMTVGSPDASPRLGQARLAEAVRGAVTQSKHTVGIAPTGVGKALDIDTPIPTPSGWTTMGELRPGDKVFADDGSTCNVLQAHPVRTDRPCFEVEFSDGQKIVADAEHLWAVATRATRATQSDRRRNAKQHDSTGYYERLLKLEATRESIEVSGFMQTMSGMAINYRGLLRRDTVGKTRRALGFPPLKAGEAFDLRPVLDFMIASARARSTVTNPLAQEIVTTAEIAQNLIGQSGALNFAVDVARPLDLPEQDLVIAPYTLGAWLGDGTACRHHITSETEEIPGYIADDGYVLTKLVAKYLYSIHLTETVCSSQYSPSFTGLLGELGVRSNKHIPTAYLRASYEQRLALLQGLMDTDGTINKTGRCEITVTNERLAEGIFELVSGLGIKAFFKSGPAGITERDPEDPDRRIRRIVGTRYRIGFVTTLPVFRLKRKAALIPKQARENNLRRYIKAVTPVASRPVRCIYVDSPSHLFLAGRAMIPTHNTYALLAPAFEAAALHGQRAVLSTESLSLQAQILDKDAPVVAAATKKATGKDVTFAVLKGFGNYACHSKAAATAGILAQEEGTNLARLRSGLRFASKEGQLWVDGVALDRADLIPLVHWALEQNADDKPGDRHSYTGKLDEGLWRAVSVTTSECIGTECPFAELCRPQKSREKAAQADIVITNHAMLAVQAATGTPVVVGNKNLGWFDSVIVDEAHNLPAAVRSHGSAEISQRRLLSAVRAMKDALPEGDTTCTGLRTAGTNMADTTAAVLSDAARGLKTGETRSLGDGDDPLEPIADDLAEWAKLCARALKERAARSTPREALSARRAATAFEGIVADIRAVRVHRAGVARWLTVEEGREGRPQAVLALTPVDVAAMLRRNLWTAEAPVDEEDELAQAAAEAGEPDEQPRVSLAAVCVSATLPAGFPREAGLDAAVEHYESPFEAAFGASLLFIPKLTPADTAELYPGHGEGRRAKFDPARHQAWAAHVAADLVEANLGAALVLSANSTAGKAYTEALRRAAKGRWRVLSQWDGLSTGQLVQAWREDESAVLVGTKSLMTGVDAKGRTCSLVIVDRVPRAASNPVDDARSEAIQTRLETDRWSADRLVYCTDAALLLEQALGRLIRSVSDSGLAAVLDPRLLPGGPVAYPAPTRKVYEAAYGRFERRITDQSEAEEFLARQAARHASLEAA